jgi:flagellar motor protein MotB
MADNKTRAGREQNRRVEVCTVLKVEKKVRVTE